MATLLSSAVSIAAQGEPGKELYRGKILIVPSKVTLEWLSDGQQVQNGEQDAKRVSLWLMNLARAELVKNEVADTDNFSSLADSSALEALQVVSNVFTTRSPNLGEVTDLLKLACSSAPAHSALLFQYLRIKIGEERSSSFVLTNPLLLGWRLEQKAGTNSSHLRVALIDCHSGTQLWRNDILVRKLPSLEVSEFSKTMATVFSNFPNWRK